MKVTASVCQRKSIRMLCLLCFSLLQWWPAIGKPEAEAQIVINVSPEDLDHLWGFAWNRFDHGDLAGALDGFVRYSFVYEKIPKADRQIELQLSRAILEIRGSVERALQERQSLLQDLNSCRSQAAGGIGYTGRGLTQSPVLSLPRVAPHR